MSERDFEQLPPQSGKEERVRRIDDLDRQRCQLLNQRAEIEVKLSLERDPAKAASHSQDLEELKKKIEEIVKEMRGLGANWV